MTGVYEPGLNHKFLSIAAWTAIKSMGIKNTGIGLSVTEARYYSDPFEQKTLFT